MSEQVTLRERIETVANAEADGERLVSAAVPADGSLGEMRERVQEDYAEAEYLNEREEVSKPLKRAIDEVKGVLNEYDETPENGLAVYAGVVDGELTTHVLDDLPDPVTETTYGYDNTFDTAPIEPSVPGTDTYGLLVVAREEAVLGRYDGTDVEVVETVESDVPSKQAAEGRNEDRFEGRSEERREEFFDAVGEAAERTFLGSPSEETGDADPVREPTVAGLVLGGSEVMVETFRDGEHLPDPLADGLMGPFTVEYAAEPGLRQLVDSAQADGAFDDGGAHETLERFFEALDGDEPAVGGPDDVERALEHDAVETLVLVDSRPPAEVQSFEERAAEIGAESVIVSADLERAERLREAFGGVGAILRFPLD
jgi:peptide chain release factor 1